MSLRDVWHKLFDTFVWYNFPSTSSPVNAANLNKMNTAIDGIDDRVLELKTGLDGVTEDLDDKVDKVAGKGLSTNDYDNTAKGIVDGVTTALAEKVDKVNGKGLSTNDFDNTYKDKLDGISAQANKVEITPVVTEGTTLATISIDGVDTDIKGSDIDVDDEMSTTSTNPVQNKVIYEALNNILPEETAEGNPISVTDASGLSAKSCEVAMNPIQDLHGQSNPYPAGGGKNLIPLTVNGIKSANSVATWTDNSCVINNVTFTILTDSDNNVIGIKANGTANATANLFLGKIDYVANTPMTLNSGVNTGSNNISFRMGGFGKFVYTDLNKASTGTDISFTLESSGEIWGDIRVGNGEQANNLVFKPYLFTQANPMTEFAPYSNICPISGRDSVALNHCGKNLFSTSVVGHKNIQPNGTVYDDQSDRSATVDAIKVLPNTQYTVSNGRNIDTGIFFYQNNDYKASSYLSWQTTPKTFTTPSDCNYIRFSFKATDITNAQLELGDTATTYEPYNGTTHTATFPDTVYGGSHEFVSGKVKSEWGYIASYNGETITEPWISSIDVYVAGTTPSTGAEVCYKLTTPQEITLTPETIALLKGNNVLFTDGDSVKLVYSADIKSYIAEQLAQLS